MCVMVVEDETLLRSFLVEELEAAGLKVMEAATADAAIQLIKNLDPPLKVLVTDVHMPGRQNGVDLAAYITKHLPDVPVIFTTGRPDVLADLGIPHENQALVSKPYSFDELVKRVQDLMSK